MVLVGYGSSRALLRVGLVFFAVAAAFGGGVLALELLGGGQAAGFQGGIHHGQQGLAVGQPGVGSHLI